MKEEEYNMSMIRKLLGKFNLREIQIKQSNQMYSPSESLQRKVTSIWTDAKKTYGDTLWNGINYRLEKIDAIQGKPLLTFGTTDYMNNYASAQLSEDISKLSFENRFNCLYVSTLVETTDGKFVLGQTAKKGIHGTTIALLGGILNKNEMEIHSGIDLQKYAYKELEEELQITQKMIDATEGLGIFEMPTCRIGIFLHTRLLLNSADLKANIKINEEHDSYKILTREEIAAEQKSDTITFNRGVSLALDQIK